MEGRQFTDDEIARCKAAMNKPAPLRALRAIVAGEVVVSLTKDRRDVYIEQWFGRRPQDPDFPDDPSRRIGLSGAWPLYRAGLIDETGKPTDLGRELAKVVP